MRGDASDSGAVDPRLVTYTHVIYALHAASLLVGIVGAASIVGAFLFGIPSILAVILNYVWRGDVRGTWLESHFRWQIRTFWFAFAWAAVGAVVMATVVLFFVAFAIWFGVAIWVIYRVMRGWLNLREERSAPA
ncbi:hypothetical protein K2X89_02370 [Myxococcota bacterium]|nr:hypothetical protein [Myxococcota bacterium]